MIVSTWRHISFSTLSLGPPMGPSLAWRQYVSMSSQNYNLLHPYYKLSALNSLIAHLDFEQSCAGSGSSWGPAISPIRPETPGGGPSSPTYLLWELPFGAERWIEGSISRSEQLERTAQLLAACLEQKKKITSAGSSNSLHFIGLAAYQKQFCQSSIYNMCIFQKATQKSSHTQAALKDKCLILKRCRIYLNTVIKIHNNAKEEWVMQIVKAYKDIVLIAVRAPVCACLPT